MLQKPFPKQDQNATKTFSKNKSMYYKKQTENMKINKYIATKTKRKININNDNRIHSIYATKSPEHNL